MKLVYVVFACLLVYAALAEDFQSGNEMHSNVASNPVTNEKSMEQDEEESHRNDEQSEGQQEQDILSQDEISNILPDDDVAENQNAIHKQPVERSVLKSSKGLWSRRRRRRYVDPCAGVKHNLNSCKHTTSRLNAEKSSLYTTISRINSEKSRLQSQLSHCQSASNRYQSEFNRCKSEKNSLSGQASQYKNNLNRCQSDKGILSSRNSALKRENNNLRQKCH